MFRYVCVLFAASVAMGSASSVELREIASTRMSGAEIVAYSAGEGVALASGNGVVRAMRFEGDGFEEAWRRSARAWAPGFGVDADVTHVAVDPLGRGFFAALVIPGRKWERTGRLVIGEIATGEAIGVYEVGYGPDACAFTPDGSAIIVANEGEGGESALGGYVDPVGSVSVFRVSDSSVTTRALLPTAKRMKGEVRVHPANVGAEVLDLEPEYVAVLGDRAYVVLQENNAYAVVDWESGEVERIFGFEALLAVVDVDDQDGSAGIHTSVTALAAPDQIAAFEEGGRGYLVTVNEGDDRGEWGEDPRGDTRRIGKLREAGLVRGHAALGDRLKVCAFSGDLDGDGVIERPTLLGTRSVSVWDAETGERVSDTGSMFETAMSKHAAFYNATGEAGLRVDSRSDDRGPEPEGVALGVIGGRRYAFVGLERPGAIAVVDLSEVGHPALSGLHVSAARGRYAPEGMSFVGGAASGLGGDVLFVAYEGSGEIVAYAVNVIEK